MERTDQPTPQPTPTAGDIYCAYCRERTAALVAARAAFDTENGASIRRRDRLTLGPRTVHTPAVTA